MGKFNSIDVFLRQKEQCESLILASITQILKNPASFEMSGNYFKRFSVCMGRGGGSHFLDNCLHCPGHDACGVIVYIFLPDHTEVKNRERTLRPAINQQIFNELLLRAEFCTGYASSLSFIHTPSSAAPCYFSPPQFALLRPPAQHRPRLGLYSLHHARL